MPLQEVLLPAETLKALGTERVVISGGEPRLHPQLREILSYYRKLKCDVVVISNGYGLNREEVSRIIKYGATGITVSLDSVDSDETALTKETPVTVHQRILSDIEHISRQPRDFELGVNSVVSHVTANWKTVRELLEFGQRIKVDFIKFQPIFNDGYVEVNAPHLLLTGQDQPALLEIGHRLETLVHPPTNPPDFWTDIAALAAGEELSPKSCGLGPRQSIAVRGTLGICFWLDRVTFGQTTVPLAKESVLETRGAFEEAKLTCRVASQCFCTQHLSHVWRSKEEDSPVGQANT